MKHAKQGKSYFRKQFFFEVEKPNQRFTRHNNALYCFEESNANWNSPQQKLIRTIHCHYDQDGDQMFLLTLFANILSNVLSDLTFNINSIENIFVSQKTWLIDWIRENTNDFIKLLGIVCGQYMQRFFQVGQLTTGHTSNDIKGSGLGTNPPFLITC